MEVYIVTLIILMTLGFCLRALEMWCEDPRVC